MEVISPVFFMARIPPLNKARKQTLNAITEMVSMAILWPDWAAREAISRHTRAEMNWRSNGTPSKGPVAGKVMSWKAQKKRLARKNKYPNTMRMFIGIPSVKTA
jgi:hypothetical protein